MTTYTLYIEDERYAAPTLLTVEVRGDERVRELASERLAQSPHYRAVEIWDDDRLVGKVEAGGRATAPAT